MPRIPRTVGATVPCRGVSSGGRMQATDTGEGVYIGATWTCLGVACMLPYCHQLLQLCLKKISKSHCRPYFGSMSLRKKRRIKWMFLWMDMHHTNQHLLPFSNLFFLLNILPPLICLFLLRLVWLWLSKKCGWVTIAENRRVDATCPFTLHKISWCVHRTKAPDILQGV